MVGWALAQLSSGQDIPAHRVVNHKGELSGRHHFRPPEKMQQLLELEGLVIIDDKVADFKSFVWVPANELDQADADL
jgi:methylated-DNA-protein-cysteine methyltransferase-like protein